MPSKSSNEKDEKCIWIRGDLQDSWDEAQEILGSGNTTNVDLAIVKSEDVPRARKLGLENIGVMTKGDKDAPQGVTLIDTNPSPDSKIRDAAWITIESGEDQVKATRLADQYDNLIIECANWQVIPIENLIAASEEKECKLVASVADLEEAQVALGALQKGVDGILIAPSKADDVKDAASLVRSMEGTLSLSEVEIVSVQGIGSGDRACIDTCSLLVKGEGVLIGSQADGLLLIHAENIETEYVESRPFRINAGAIHSYILDNDNKTRYLSELRGGDTTMVVKSDGTTRTATIGRVKIETRPLSMVVFRHQGRTFKAMLQDAETIRLVDPQGEAASIKDLKEGDHVLAYLSGQARHFGMAVEEKLIER